MMTGNAPLTDMLAPRLVYNISLVYVTGAVGSLTRSRPWLPDLSGSDDDDVAEPTATVEATPVRM